MNEGSGPSVRRRKPVVAALLSALTCGLGQVYNGQAGKGVALWAAGPGVFFAAAWSGFLGDFVGLSLTILACLCLYVYAVTDAFLEAGRRKGHVLKAYNRWYVYALFVGVSAFILAPGFQSILPIKSYRNPTGSMEPTVRVGDHLLARRHHRFYISE
jgi:signal peptidase I